MSDEDRLKLGRTIGQIEARVNQVARQFESHEHKFEAWTCRVDTKTGEINSSLQSISRTQAEQQKTLDKLAEWPETFQESCSNHRDETIDIAVTEANKAAVEAIEPIRIQFQRWQWMVAGASVVISGIVLAQRLGYLR